MCFAGTQNRHNGWTCSRSISAHLPKQVDSFGCKSHLAFPGSGISSYCCDCDRDRSLMATLEIAGECPDVRTLVADCELSSDNSTVSFCLAGTSEDEESQESQESSQEEQESEESCKNAVQIELTALTAVGIEAVDFTALGNTTSIGELYEFEVAESLWRGRRLKQVWMSRNVSFNEIEYAEDVEVPAGLTSMCVVIGSSLYGYLLTASSSSAWTGTWTTTRSSSLCFKRSGERCKSCKRVHVQC